MPEYVNGHSELLSLDQLIETAYDIFYELADDNLEQNDLTKYQEFFDEKGAAVAVDVSADWQQHVDFEINEDWHVEIKIGFADDDQITDVLAQILLSRNPNEKHCYLIWKRQ